MTTTYVSSGQTSSGEQVYGGDTLVVENGGSAVNVGVAGLEVVSSGGTTINVNVNNGGYLELFGGATASNYTFSRGGLIAGSGYTASGLALSIGLQYLEVASGGAATADFVGTLGNLGLDAGATVGNITFNAGEEIF